MKPLDQIGPQTLREEILAVLMAAQGPVLRDAIASRCQLAKSELAFNTVFGELIESRQVVSELAGGRTVFRLPKTGDFALPPEAAKAPSPRLGLAAYRKKVGTTRERVLSLVKERPIGRADVAKALSLSNELAAYHLSRLTRSGDLVITPGKFLYATPDQAEALEQKAEVADTTPPAPDTEPAAAINGDSEDSMPPMEPARVAEAGHDDVDPIATPDAFSPAQVAESVQSMLEDGPLIRAEIEQSLRGVTKYALGRALKLLESRGAIRRVRPNRRSPWRLAGDGERLAKPLPTATKPLAIGLVHGDIVIPPDARYGIYSDGEFYIESDDVCVRFPKSSTKAMCEFLDRVHPVTTMA